MSDNVIPLHLWEVFQFYWGSAVRDKRSQHWIRLFLKPDGQELNVENIPIIVHANGIEFIPVKHAKPP